MIAKAEKAPAKIPWPIIVAGAILASSIVLLFLPSRYAESLYLVELRKDHLPAISLVAVASAAFVLGAIIRAGWTRVPGVPGLVAMSAFVLFGIVLGVSIALVTPLVELKDSLANFLGGVVGAGLGAALAVLGSLYVQRRERLGAIVGVINGLRIQLRQLADGALEVMKGMGDDGSLETGFTVEDKAKYKSQVEELLKRLEALPSGFELPGEFPEEIASLKSDGIRIFREVFSGIASDEELPAVVFEDSVSEGGATTAIVLDHSKSVHPGYANAIHGVSRVRDRVNALLSKVRELSKERAA